MQRRKAWMSIVVAAFVIAASDPSKFYQAVPHRTPDIPTSAQPIFHQSSGDAKQDLRTMLTNGYELVGYSAFNGREAGQKGVRKQAMKVGASDVVYLEKYTETQSLGAIGNTSFSRWGAFSFVTPMSVRRYDQLAMYFRKAPREGLGVYPRPLSDEEKAKLNSNKGVAITAVVNGSPAFMADILPGDIIIAIGGRAVWDDDSIKGALDAVRGKTSDIEIVRGDDRIIKQVSIPAGAW